MKRNTFLVTFLVFLSFVLPVPGCQKNAPADEHIHITMKKFAIEPSLIRVKAGEVVELEVTTADVQHGIDIPDLGIRKAVQPGGATIITFKAPTKGEYRMACGVICGPGHDDMVGKLVVE
jgi:cytochrome c oxidase subunit 2